MSLANDFPYSDQHIERWLKLPESRANFKKICEEILGSDANPTGAAFKKKPLIERHITY